MARPTYTPAPVAPVIGEPDFPTKADAYLGWFPTFGDYTEALADHFDTLDAFTNYVTPAALKASTEAARGAGVIWRAAGFRYEELPAGTAANLIHLTTAGGVLLKVLPHAGVYYAQAIAPAANGTTDDTAVLTILRDVANAEGAYLDFGAGTYKVANGWALPAKVRGNFTLVGNVKWETVKYVRQEGRMIVQGSITGSGLWYSVLDYIDCAGYDFILDGWGTGWGTFWNKFHYLRCLKLVFDCDKGQSVNQNEFGFVRASGGVHVKGVNTTGTRQCHANKISAIDTTGANLTSADGKTGIHLLNDSNAAEMNIVELWYCESTGEGLAYGNWNIIGVQNNFTNNVFMGLRRNSQLFAYGDRRNGSFLAGSFRDVSGGGDWSQIAPTTGLPVGFGKAGNTTATVVSVTDAPDGNPTAVDISSGATFSTFHFDYPLSSDGFVAFTAYVKVTNGGSDVAPTTFNAYIQDEAGNYGVDVTKPTLTPIANGWYLMRGAFKSPRVRTASNTMGRITIYKATSTANADVWRIGSFHVTTEDMCPLPQCTFGRREGKGTAAPTAGIWSVGDVVWNSAPGNGKPLGWVCSAAEQPGTWTVMARTQNEVRTLLNERTINSDDPATNIARVVCDSYSEGTYEITVLATLTSASGGTRFAYRKSIIQERDRNLVETNLHNTIGANMALAFSFSITTLTISVDSTATAGITEDCRVTIMVVGGNGVREIEVL